MFFVVGAVIVGGPTITAAPTSTPSFSPSSRIHDHPPLRKLDEPVELSEAPDVDGPQPEDLADPCPPDGKPWDRGQRRVGRSAKAAERRGGEVAPGDRRRGQGRSERI